MTPENETAPPSGQDDGARRTATVPAAPSTLDSLVSGRFKERYLIEGQLGRGSDTLTLRARREEDGTPVVLKLLRGGSEGRARRFLRQAETVAKLDHPHIASSFEHGTAPEGPFYCRAFLSGDSLMRAIKSELLTARRLCELMTQLLSALAEAHRHGVLHGNLKPENIFVVRDSDGRETVKLCDFGALGDPRAGAAYRAPEQGRREGSIDGQADVYAAGVLLYELLTGEVPFQGESEEDTMSLHALEALVPPTTKLPGRPLPRELEAICMKALSKDPRERQRSPREMSQLLRAAISLLDARADEPLGSSAFEVAGRASPFEASERMTVPGEQLRSHTKLWLGVGLVAAVCSAVLLVPSRKPRAPEPEGARTFPPYVSGSAEGKDEGRRSLEQGMASLRAGDVSRAVRELREARKALGDTSEVLRALGEALILHESSSEGVRLLERYLEQEPTARDRKFVESLIRQGRSVR